MTTCTSSTQPRALVSLPWHAVSWAERQMSAWLSCEGSHGARVSRDSPGLALPSSRCVVSAGVTCQLVGTKLGTVQATPAASAPPLWLQCPLKEDSEPALAALRSSNHQVCGAQPSWRFCELRPPLCSGCAGAVADPASASACLCPAASHDHGGCAPHGLLCGQQGGSPAAFTSFQLHQPGQVVEQL